MALAMEHLVVSFLNTALEAPDRLATPMGTAQWWASVRPALPANTLVIHSKPRFTMELSEELRILRAHFASFALGQPTSYRMERSIPGADGVFFPLLQQAAQMYETGQLQRIKQCGEQGCRRYFLDETKNGSKRWCTLRCMERARAPRRRTIRP
jgi:predicted RNA-binding Zn ribbon-like protein